MNAEVTWAVAGELGAPAGLGERFNERMLTPDQQEAPPVPVSEGATPRLSLPPVSPPGAGEGLGRQVKVHVRAFLFEGNTVFSDEELHRVTAPFENRVITAAELQQARHALTRYYIDHGYVNSGAVIPDQKAGNGEIRIRLVEGRLTVLRVAGTDGLDPSYLSERVALFAGPPLNLNRLRDGLLVLRQSPLVEQVNAELSPGMQPGEGELKIKVKESIPYAITFGMGNNRPPSVGALRGELTLADRNLTGHGDALETRLGRTEGLEDWKLGYTYPLNARDTTLSVSVEHSDADVVEEPFNELDIISQSDKVSVGISHPLIKEPGRTVTLGLSGDRRRTQTSLLGIPFTLSAGAEEGRSVATVARFTQEYLERSTQWVLAAHSSFNLGLPWFDATVHDEDADGRFFSWNGQAQWSQRLGDSGLLWILRAETQLSADPLLAMEKFSLGGMNSVRGFRENYLVRDSGVSGGVEFRHPLFKLPIAGLSGAEDGVVLAAAFWDMGRGWNVGEDEDTAIASAGLGLRWEAGERWQARLYWGEPLTGRPEGEENDLQEQGIHFQMSLKIL